MSLQTTLVSERQLRDYNDGQYPLRDSKFYKNYKITSDGNKDSNLVVVKHPMFCQGDYLQIVNVKMNTNLYKLNGNIQFIYQEVPYSIKFSNFQAYEIQNVVSEMNRQCGQTFFETDIITDSTTNQKQYIIKVIDSLFIIQSEFELIFQGNVIQQLVDYDSKLTQTMITFSDTQNFIQPPIYQIDYIVVKCDGLNNTVQTIDENGQEMFGSDVALVITKDDMQYDNKTLDYQYEIKVNGPLNFKFVDQYNRPFNLSFIIMQIEFFNKQFFRDEVINESEEVTIDNLGQKVIIKNRTINSNKNKLHLKKQCFVKLNAMNTKVFLQDYYNAFTIQDASGNIQYQFDDTINNNQILVSINTFNPDELFSMIPVENTFYICPRPVFYSVDLSVQTNPNFYYSKNYTAFWEDIEGPGTVGEVDNKIYVKRWEKIHENELMMFINKYLDVEKIDNQVFKITDKLHYYFIRIYNYSTMQYTTIQNIFSNQIVEKQYFKMYTRDNTANEVMDYDNPTKTFKDMFLRYQCYSTYYDGIQAQEEGFFSKYAYNLANMIITRVECQNILQRKSKAIIYKSVDDNQHIVITHAALSDTDVSETTLADSIFTDWTENYILTYNDITNCEFTNAGSKQCNVGDVKVYNYVPQIYLPFYDNTQLMTCQIFVNNQTNQAQQMGNITTSTVDSEGQINVQYETKEQMLNRQGIYFAQTNQILFIDKEGDTKFQKMNQDYWTWKALKGKQNFLNFNCFLCKYDTQDFEYLQNFEELYKLNLILRIFLK